MGGKDGSPGGGNFGWKQFPLFVALMLLGALLLVSPLLLADYLVNGRL